MKHFVEPIKQIRQKKLLLRKLVTELDVYRDTISKYEREKVTTNEQVVSFSNYYNFFNETYL